MQWDYLLEAQMQRLHSGSRCIIATDGSVQRERAACAVINSVNNDVLSCRLPDFASLFEAEFSAIDIALDHILSTRQSSTIDAYFILSDSQSVLKYLKSTSFSVEKNHIWKKIHLISETAKVFLLWIPGHVGISFNERADKQARDALKLELDAARLPQVVLLPKFSINRTERLENFTRRSALFNSLDDHYEALKVRIITRKFTPFTSSVAEWIFLRFRLHRPPKRVGRVWLASPTGFCTTCPEEIFDTNHFFCLCPRFEAPRRVMLNQLRAIVSVPQLTPYDCLTCAASIPLISVQQFTKILSHFIISCISRPN